LKDESIAKAIADTINLEGYEDVLEIGRNGCFDKVFINKPINTYVIEIDTESVDYLDANYPKLKDKIISKDFCGMISMRFSRKTVCYNWKFPYNISTQIVLKP
jgi:16S rRNA (adenine1518-N6/adenine1519-N6)-dimethyltransferase